MRSLVITVVAISFCGCGSNVTPPDTGARVRHWIETLRKPEAKLRKEAAFKLGNLGNTDPGLVVPALTAALKDADPAVRCEAILALLKCRDAARNTVPELSEIQRNDDDAKVREYAGKALAKIARD
jgi:HEAT repeat protein